MARMRLLFITSLLGLMACVWGQNLATLALRDENNGAINLLALNEGRPIIAIAINPACPHNPDMQRVFDAFSRQFQNDLLVVGIVFGTPADAAQYRRERSPAFRILSSDRVEWLDAVEFRRSFEFALLHPSGQLDKKYPGFNRAVFEELPSKIRPMIGRNLAVFRHDLIRDRLTAGCGFVVAGR